jgi:ABC-type Fe3+-siderophore transport system permease subunit
MGAMVGAGLGVVGTVLQGITRNLNALSQVVQCIQASMV